MHASTSFVPTPRRISPSRTASERTSARSSHMMWMRRGTEHLALLAPRRRSSRAGSRRCRSRSAAACRPSGRSSPISSGSPSRPTSALSGSFPPPSRSAPSRAPSPAPVISDAGDHPGQFFYPILFRQRFHPGCHRAARRLLHHAEVAVGEGRHLREVRDADDLRGGGEALRRAPTRSATWPADPRVDLVEHERPPGPPREAALRSESITRDSSPPEAV